jgi:hypothetical protein
LKKRRRKRQKNKSTPQSVVLEEGKGQLTLDSVAPAAGDGAGAGEAANGGAGGPEAAVGEAGESKATAAEAVDGGAAEGEVTDPEPGIEQAEEQGASEPKTADQEAEATEALEAEVVHGEVVPTETREPEASDRQAIELEATVWEVAAEESPRLEAAVKKASKGTGRDRRQHARFVVGGRTKGRVTAIYDARILDISPGGSLIEHSHVVRPGTLSCLDLDLLGKRMSLRCRVARSVVHRTEVQPDGDKELIYHTGLEFLDSSDETRKMIIDYIQSIIGDGTKG